ncbi:MAG: HD domain-containing protein [Candidatus Gracilibacteria bacterium]|jgi:putative nucleotidyltransferase with HDIG domain|nr:HD domain-containing protein [Candidatus Gracilibacteria bacterium]
MLKKTNYSLDLLAGHIEQQRQGRLRSKPIYEIKYLIENNRSTEALDIINQRINDPETEFEDIEAFLVLRVKALTKIAVNQVLNIDLRINSLKEVLDSADQENNIQITNAYGVLISDLIEKGELEKAIDILKHTLDSNPEAKYTAIINKSILHLQSMILDEDLKSKRKSEKITNILERKMETLKLTKVIDQLYIDIPELDSHDWERIHPRALHNFYNRQIKPVIAKTGLGEIQFFREIHQLSQEYTTFDYQKTTEIEKNSMGIQIISAIIGKMILFKKAEKDDGNMSRIADIKNFDSLEKGETTKNGEIGMVDAIIESHINLAAKCQCVNNPRDAIFILKNIIELSLRLNKPETISIIINLISSYLLILNEEPEDVEAKDSTYQYFNALLQLIGSEANSHNEFLEIPSSEIKYLTIEEALFLKQIAINMEIHEEKQMSNEDQLEQKSKKSKRIDEKIENIIQEYEKLIAKDDCKAEIRIGFFSFIKELIAYYLENKNLKKAKEFQEKLREASKDIDDISLVKSLAESSEKLLTLAIQKIKEGDESFEIIAFVLSYLAEGEKGEDVTPHHVRNVCILTEAFTRDLGFNEESVSDLKVCALLHDIGKIKVGDSIINKRGRLTDEEYKRIQKHTTYGAIIAQKTQEVTKKGIFRLIEQAAESHHEKWNGTGYPHGLKGEEIPLFGRIIAITDVFEALTASRSYKKAMSTKKSLYIMTEKPEFAPSLLLVFIKNIKKYIPLLNKNRESNESIDETNKIVDSIDMFFQKQDPKELPEVTIKRFNEFLINIFPELKPKDNKKSWPKPTINKKEKLMGEGINAIRQALYIEYNDSTFYILKSICEKLKRSIYLQDQIMLNFIVSFMTENPEQNLETFNRFKKEFESRFNTRDQKKEIKNGVVIPLKAK